MTDVRELLRDTAAAVVVPPRSDPLPAIRRAAARRRAAAGVTAAAVAAGLVAGTIVWAGSAATHSVITHPHPAPPPRTVRSFGQGDAAVTGFGSAWVLHTDGSGTGQETVDQETLSGRHVRSIDVPAPAAQLVVGTRRLWVAGTTDGGPTAVSAVDPQNGRVQTWRTTDPFETYNFGPVAAGDSLWLGRLHDLLELTPTAGGLHTITLAVETPQWLAVTGTGQLWVEHGHEQLTHVEIGGVPRFGQTSNGGQELLGPAIGDSMWITAGRGFRGLQPDGWFTAVQRGAVFTRGPFLTSGIPQQLVTATNGVYVATDHGVDFFSHRALAAGSGPSSAHFHDPTTMQGRDGVAGIAADGDGVLITNADGTILDWTPVS